MSTCEQALPAGTGSADRVAGVIRRVRNKGVKLWSDQGKLRYKAPPGALTLEEIEHLRALKGEIIAHLDRAAVKDHSGSEGERSDVVRRAPLTYSQLSHRNLYRLAERAAVRQIATAMRVRGALNIEVLDRSITAVVHRHDALRTRIVVNDGVPMQEVYASCDSELELRDLSRCSESRQEAEIGQHIDEMILRPIELAAGPLLGMRLLKLCDDEYVLIIVMEHIISDAFSMGILLRELFTAYKQTLRGEAQCLPPISVQFPDYAIWQQSMQPAWLAQHGSFWREQARRCTRLRFPDDADVVNRAEAGWRASPFTVSKALKTELREWCRQNRTTLVMSMFTAYVALVLRWCNTSEACVQYQTDGRVSSEISNTIGFFAWPLYLHIELRANDRFIDLLHRATEAWCEAHEHADFCYLEAQEPRPEFARNSAFNWVPYGGATSSSNLLEIDPTLTLTPISFTHPMLENLDRDNEPVLLLYEYDQYIEGGVYYPRKRFSEAAMTRFASNYLACVEALLHRPEGRVTDFVLTG